MSMAASSSTIGLYVAAGVGGVALIGLIILGIWKWRQRRRKGGEEVASTAPYMSSRGPLSAAYSSSSHPFRPLEDNTPVPVVATSSASSTFSASDLPPPSSRRGGLPSNPRSVSHLEDVPELARPVSQEAAVEYMAPSPLSQSEYSDGGPQSASSICEGITFLCVRCVPR